MSEPMLMRDYQQKGVQIFEQLPEPKRYFFAWDMGAGKTYGSIAVARAYARNRLLVICPAIVRENWARELGKHWPGASVGVITHGRTRKLSPKQTAEREKAYAATIQVVSYDLLHHVRATDWDMVIVDEFHNLRSPGSKQSKWVRVFFQANPKAWALGLSGTPIPNEAQQLWNPVDTFFPGRWGKRTPENRIPWGFLNTYCNREVNEWGTKFYGVREEGRLALEAAFSKISMRVVQADFAKYLPPLFVEPLYQKQQFNSVALAQQWIESLPEEVRHVGIYTHLRSTAMDVCAKVGGHLITGATSASTRDRVLEVCRKEERSLVVGTTHALKEGISLSFQKAALVLEWTTDVAEVVQFIGRFGRQDSTSQVPTRVDFVVGPNDHGKAETLSRRIADIQSLIKASRADKMAAGVFAPVEMSDDDYQAELHRIIQSQEKRAGLWSAGEDDDDDDL